MPTWDPRANDLFLKALEMRLPGERREFLDRACVSDAALRAEVEALLEASAKADNFLEFPAVKLGATIDEPILEGPGTVVGSYKLLEQIGEGGFGVVFMAEQTQPVRRKVALKVLKPGMDTKQVVARFDAERQALAIMDHPNIAKVHDGGATASGRPYFVMELVKGVTITEFCDQNHLTPRQRLELFVPVCQAVQHAHQKGIIHRDLKPSNVLVSRHDTTPVPKIIDFGVAKALGQELTEKTLFTGIAQMIGTPLYMSPEQAGMSDLDVDTRSDLYSLGVLLYELLTGTTPFDKERLKQAAYDEIRRIIREEDPPKPSTRLSELGRSSDASKVGGAPVPARSAGPTSNLASVSALRHTEPAKLTKLVRGELDWIVMKALEKDRNRRYETANGFAADVQRYLNDEPVQACPPSAGYRLRKFARRHKAALMTLALLVAVLVAGTTVSTWQAIRATQAEGLAQERLGAEKKARTDADTQREAAETQRQLAEANLRLARQAVDEMYTEVAERWLRDQPHLEPVQRQFIAKALQFYEHFANQESGDPAGRLEAAQASRRVGYIRRALQQHSKVAEDAFRQAIGILEKLATEFPREPKYRAALAETQGEFGWQRRLAGQHREAEQALRQALALFEGLAAEFPNDCHYQEKLANSHLSFGLQASNPGEAEPSLRHSLLLYQRIAIDLPTVIDRQVDVAHAHTALGNFLEKTGWVDEAEKEYRRAVELHEKVAADFPNHGASPRLFAGHLGALASLLRANGRAEEAARLYRRRLGIQEKLLLQHRESYHAHGIADSQRALASLLPATGRQEELEVIYRRSLDLYEKLTALFPMNRDWSIQLITEYNRLGDCLRDAGKSKEAEKVYGAGLTAGEIKVADFPDDWQLRIERARALARLGKDQAAAADFAKAVELKPKDSRVWVRRGQVYAELGRWADADRDFTKAIELHSDAARELALWCGEFAERQRHAGHAEDAGKAFAQAIKAYRKLLEFSPKSAVAHNNLAWLLATCADPRVRVADQAVELAKKAVELAPKEGNFWNTLGAAQYRVGDCKAALAALEKSMELRKGGDSNDWFFLAMTYWQLDHKEQARKYYDQAVDWMEKKQPQNEELVRFRSEAADLLKIEDKSKSK